MIISATLGSKAWANEQHRLADVCNLGVSCVDNL